MSTFNIDSYGAPTDETTVANTYITAAASAANSAGGGIVLIPDRTYICNDLDLSLYANIVYVFSGRNSVFKLYGSVDPSSPFIVKIGAGCRVTEGTFDPNDIANSTCIRITGVDNTEIDHCHFTSPRSGGVYIEGTCDKVNVHDCTSSGAGYFLLTASDAAITHLKITENNLTGAVTRGDGIELNNTSGTLSHFLIANNTITGFTAASTAGIAIGVSMGTHGAIVGNQIDGCREGIHLEDQCVGITVAGNNIDNCANRAISANSNVSGTISEITIVGNTCTNCFTTTSTSTGVIAIEGTYAKKSIVITGNTIATAGAVGIILSGQTTGALSYVVVAHNTVRNCTGAGILAIRLTEATIQGNICFDDDSGSQTYGLELRNAQTNVYIYDNNMNDNATAGVLETTLSGTYTYARNAGITDGP